MSQDAEVDRLYQVPLGEFTAARNALAKGESSVARAAEIRALQKPSVPAWAVNQFFWKRRKTFDRLIDAARKLRVEHGRQLSGKSAEVDAAEARHRDALKAAADDIREILKAAGEQDSHATMIAVAETLQALPARDDHGRLVKPLKPMGFEALAGLVGGSGATIARLAEVKPVPPKPVARVGRDDDGRARARDEAARRKQASQARAKDIAAAERALHRAEVHVRASKAELSRAEMAHARLQRERKELQERVDSVTSRRDQAAVDLDERRRAADRAKSERDRLAAQVDALKAT